MHKFKIETSLRENNLIKISLITIIFHLSLHYFEKIPSIYYSNFIEKHSNSILSSLEVKKIYKNNSSRTKTSSSSRSKFISPRKIRKKKRRKRSRRRRKSLSSVKSGTRHKFLEATPLRLIRIFLLSSVDASITATAGLERAGKLVRVTVGPCLFVSLAGVEQEGQEKERRKGFLVGSLFDSSRRWLIGSNRVESSPETSVVDALVSRLKFQLLEGIGRRRGVKTSSNLSLIGRRRRFR